MQDSDIDISQWCSDPIPKERLKKPDVLRSTFVYDRKGKVIGCKTSQNPCLDHLLDKRIITEDQHSAGIDLVTLVMVARAYLGYRGSRADPEFTDRSGFSPAEMPGMTDRFHRAMRQLGPHWRTLEEICIDNRLNVCLMSNRHVVTDAFEALEELSCGGRGSG